MVFKFGSLWRQDQGFYRVNPGAALQRDGEHKQNYRESHGQSAPVLSYYSTVIPPSGRIKGFRTYMFGVLGF